MCRKTFLNYATTFAVLKTGKQVPFLHKNKTDINLKQRICKYRVAT